MKEEWIKARNSAIMLLLESDTEEKYLKTMIAMIVGCTGCVDYIYNKSTEEGKKKIDNTRREYEERYKKVRDNYG